MPYGVDLGSDRNGVVSKAELKILCVHPNYELYGSDRSFANTVAALRKAWPKAGVKVRLPRSGPILTLDGLKDATVETEPFWILRRRGLLKSVTLELPKHLKALWSALRAMRANDVNYINTVIGFDFILMARFSGRPTTIHVREIPVGIEMTVFRALLLFSGADLLFNSEATRAAFRIPASRQTGVVYNGYADPGEPAPIPPLAGRPIRVLVIGRINHWKGQEILIEAVGRLDPAIRAAITVRIVGDTFNNQDDFRDKLVEQIARLGLGNAVKLDPFEDDPTGSFEWADVVVVPSRLPEPFGRVAIEAMAHGRPVIVAAHGGLTEIVVDGESGRHFKPGDADDLGRILGELIAQPELIRTYGAGARERFDKCFTNEVVDAQFVALMDERFKRAR